MAEIWIEGDGYGLHISAHEFITIKNCMNEALEALQEKDFSIRVGATREEAIELLEFLLAEVTRLRES